MAKNLGLLLTGVMAILLLAGASCEEQPPANETSVTETAALITPSPCPVVRGEPANGLVAQLVLDGGRTEFRQGEPIATTLFVINCGDEPVRRAYPDSQRYDFSVTNEQGQEVWRWSHDLFFLQVIGEKILQPDEVVTYLEVWDQTSNDGEPVPLGRYELLGLDAGCEALGANCHFGMGLPIEITP